MKAMRCTRFKPVLRKDALVAGATAKGIEGENRSGNIFGGSWPKSVDLALRSTGADDRMGRRDGPQSTRQIRGIGVSVIDRDDRREAIFCGEANGERLLFQL